MAARERLIVALDFPTGAEAQILVDRLGDSVSTYKVGKQLFTAEGPAVVRGLIAQGKRVFLDLKLHDIPNTVAGAVTEAARLGVSMMTVHASGGSKMLAAAAEAAQRSPNPPLILAVTLLTSLGDQDLAELGIAGSASDQVLRLGKLAEQAGCKGLVASAHEAQLLRQQLGRDMALVTPGVRPAGTSVGDQARVVTPAGALNAGADYIVVGRPITAAADPVEAASSILRELASATVA